MIGVAVVFGLVFLFAYVPAALLGGSFLPRGGSR